MVGAELTQLGVDFGRGLDLMFLRDAKLAKSVLLKSRAVPDNALRSPGPAPPKLRPRCRRDASRHRAGENKMEKRLDEMVNAYRAGDGPKLSRVVQEEFGTSAEGLAARKARV